MKFYIIKRYRFIIDLGILFGLFDLSEEEKQRVNISGVRDSEIIGAGISGSGHIIGENIIVGNGTINVNEQRLSEIQNNEYAQSLKSFSETLNEQLKGQQIPEEQVKSINKDIEELATEVKDVKAEKEEEIDYIKKTNIESKTANLIQKVLNILPQAAETTATFTPLAPFSKLIGKGVQGIVDAISKRK